ncbi:MAG TPA: hypothetical protein VGG20_17450 [Thermoanaerobaculia bacterium]
MSNSLQANAAGTQAPPGQQTVAVTNVSGGQATTTIQAPNSGNIWFAFGIGSGSANLTVNFNGQNYPNVPPGEYTLSGVTTPLGLTVNGNGSMKLAWIAF